MSNNAGMTSQLEFSESKLEAVLNTVIDGIITINQGGIVRSFNPSAVRIFGYQPNEVIGNNVNMLMPEPYHAEHDGYLKNYLNSGDKKIIGIGREVRAKRKDGSIFPMELGVNQMIIDGETMFVGTIRDISDRKKAEQALTDNQAKLQAIVDNTVDGLITIDAKGHIETFNKACERIFGYQISEVMGKNVKMLMPAPYKKEHDGYLKNYHDTGAKKIIGSGREVKGKRKNGEIFPLDLSVSEVNVQGRKLYSGIVRDISERKKAEHEIKQANAELEEFSYRTSHDLRSPLISSIKLLELVENAVVTGDKANATNGIQYIRKSLSQLEALVQDILQITHTKNLVEENQWVDVSELIEESVKKFEYMENFDQLTIRLEFRFADKLLVKKSRLALIVENLISNAIKYQDLQNDHAYISINTDSRDDHFVLRVQDNGIGIPKEQQQNLFQMFKRFHPRVSFGSGLGLYMMKKSADVLGGNILFEAPVEGSVFTFTMPVRQ